MLNITKIADEQVRLFYIQYLPQYTILKDFYTALPEEQYSFRMVDVPERQSDTPRESLAHLLEYRLLVLYGVQTRIFEFKSMQVEHYWQSPRAYLLAEWERIEQALFDYLTSPAFNSDAQVATPWGIALTAVNTLYLIRDHDILHVGWNLAIMDHLGMERFDTLKAYWG